MRLPQPTFTTVGIHGKAALQKYEVIVLPAYASLDGPVLEKGAEALELLAFCGESFEAILAKWPDYLAKPGELIEIPLTDSGKLLRLLILGIGTGSTPDSRKAGAALGRKVKSTGYSIFSAYTADFDTGVAHLTAISLAQYGWSLKSAHSKADMSAREKGASCFTFGSSLEEAVRRASILAEAVWITRDLIHTPSNIKTPAWLAATAKQLVKSAKAPELSVVVKKGRQLESFGGLRAVGNSSPSAAPHLIEIHYEPTEGKNLLHVVLVGKGITYDTGGLSLKRPFDLMIPMKSDMAGAAAILAATLAMAKLQPRIRVTALMVSATAQRPSDVITQYGGTTVEVINTDAEGRLVLADGLAYADLELKPDYLLDIATLTGSATLGLGKQFAAMYSRNLTLTTTLHEIGERTGDRVWMMPLIDDYLPALVSPVADFNHDASAQNFGAGSVTAALFLEQFVGQRRWVHLDIAGPARSEVDSGEVIKGGTGFGTRLLIEWLVSLS
jgi:leucyl aminopeptidase